MEIKKYELKPDVREFKGISQEDKIYLSIQIGNGQVGGSKVFLDGEKVAKGDLSKLTFIGDAGRLAEKELIFETKVLDVNNYTNMCVITTSILNQDNKVLYSKIDSGEAPESGVACFTGVYKLTLALFLFFLSSFFTSTMGNAQSSLGNMTFSSLETPASPGFILLDQTPSSIERPTTPQGFGFNVLALVRGTGGAMEFAPFWLMNHPNLTAEEMNKNHFPFLYNLSISAATVKTDSSSYLAGGFRTRLFQSFSKVTLSKLDSVLLKLKEELADLDPSNPDFTEIEELKKAYAELSGKPLFTVDFAGALGGGSTTNSFNDVVFNRWSAWLSMNWRPKGDDFYFTVLTRYINNEKYENYSIRADLVDIGSRLNYDLNRFCVSMEYLQRINLTTSSGSDFRVAVVGSYAFSDNVFITATFGKNFSQVNNIIALAGINFGISRSKINAFN